MQITKIKIENFKCWENLEFENLSKFNVIIGENNLGKSAILEAILKSAKGSFLNMPEQDWIQRNKNKFQIQVWVNFFDEWLIEIIDNWAEKYNIEENLVDFLKSSDRIWKNFRFYGWGEKDILSGGFRTDSSCYSNATEIDALSGLIITNHKKSKNKEDIRTYAPLNFLISEIKEKLQNCFIFISSRRKIVTEYIREPLSSEIRYTGIHLKKKLINLIVEKDTNRKLLFKKFQNIVKNISFSPGTPDLHSESGKEINLIFRKVNGETVQIEELGDGIRDLIIIIGLCIYNPDKIILIEEPELHLHPRAVRELRNVLKYDLDNQIFLATHNPAFIGKINENTTIIKIIKSNNGPKAILIKDKEDLLQFRMEFGLQNSDFLFEDLIVFVEGKTDLLAFSTWLELLYPKNLSIKFIASGGGMQVASDLALSLMLRLEQNFLLFSILDKDDRNIDEVKNTIIKKIKKKIPTIVKEIGEENIKKWIYVLKKSELESYFLNSKILSKWFNVPEDEIIETLNEIEENNDYKKLNKIFQKYGGSYKKSRDTKDFAETFSNEDMDPEIKRLFEMLISKSNP